MESLFLYSSENKIIKKKKNDYAIILHKLTYFCKF